MKSSTAISGMITFSLIAPIATGGRAETGEKQLVNMARASQCAAHSWKERGRAPAPYISGMALVFARAVCHPERPDVQVVSAVPEQANSKKDALVQYQQEFAAKGMRNDKAGLDTLRHTYVLLIGLGMMESSGKYCEGRDVSQCFVTAESAESGLFQTSYGVRTSSDTLTSMFKAYKANTSGCMLPEFSQGVTCKIRKSHNPKCPDVDSGVTGTGPGADWQQLTKTCPAFATEYAAVVLRRHGGSAGEFNPIRKKQAELLPQCDSLLKQVQDYVLAHPSVCSSL